MREKAPGFGRGSISTQNEQNPRRNPSFFRPQCVGVGVYWWPPGWEGGGRMSSHLDNQNPRVHSGSINPINPNRNRKFLFGNDEFPKKVWANFQSLATEFLPEVVIIDDFPYLLARGAETNGKFPKEGQFKKFEDYLKEEEGFLSTGCGIIFVKGNEEWLLTYGDIVDIQTGFSFQKSEKGENGNSKEKFHSNKDQTDPVPSDSWKDWPWQLPVTKNKPGQSNLPFSGKINNSTFLLLDQNKFLSHLPNPMKNAMEKINSYLNSLTEYKNDNVPHTLENPELKLLICQIKRAKSLCLITKTPLNYKIHPNREPFNPIPILQTIHWFLPKKIPVIAIQNIPNTPY